MKNRSIKHALLALCGILFFGLAAFFSAAPKTLVKIDLTKEKIHTLSNASLAIIENSRQKNETIQINTFFRNDSMGARFSEIINLYKSKGAPLKISAFDPKTATSEVKQYNIEPGSNIVIFEVNSKQARIEIINEEKITNAIAKVIQNNDAPKILVVAGQGESPMVSADGPGFAKYYKVLSGSGYSLEEKVIANLSSEEIKKYRVLVILDPKIDFEQSAIAKLEEYSLAGGSVYLTLGAWKELPNLQDWIATKGVLFNNDALIIDPKDSRAKKYGAGNAVLSKLNATHRVSRFLGATGARYGVLLPDARSLNLLQAKDRKIFREVLASTGRPTMVLPDVKSASRRKFNSGDLLDKQPAVAAFIYRNYIDQNPSEKKKFKMIVTGASTFANNMGYQNPILRELFLNSMSFLSDSEDFIAIAAPKELDSQIDLTSKNSAYALNFIFYFYPLMILGAGIFNWWRRMQR